MPTRPLRLAALVIVAILLPFRPHPSAEEPGDHDFGDVVVVFTLEYEDDLLPAPPWALVRASIRRLGNVFFLTGVEPEAGRTGARRHWIPLADVVRLAEYDDVAAARAALEGTLMEEESDRPVSLPVGL